MNKQAKAFHSYGADILVGRTDKNIISKAWSVSGGEGTMEERKAGEEVEIAQVLVDTAV